MSWPGTSASATTPHRKLEILQPRQEERCMKITYVTLGTNDRTAAEEFYDRLLA